MPNPSASAHYDPATRNSLLQLARRALVQAVEQGTRLQLKGELAPALLEAKGSFVTLTQQGNLRGCIGNIEPELPLGEAVVLNAYRAALKDPRFAPVMPHELPSIEVEVSVLSVPRALGHRSAEELLARLRPETDGVVLQVGERRSTFLPQVWEKLPRPVDFLNHLAEKAGLPAAAWRGPDAEVFVYQVEAFAESEQSRPYQ